MRSSRPLWQSLLLIVSTVLAGLVVRFVPLGLPHVVTKYGGSALWALTIYWIVSALLPRAHLLTATFISAALATAVELAKLYHAPALDAFRLTLPGKLLLGHYFSLRDIVAYWAAIGLGAMLDNFLRRPRND